jgi:thiamine pyrophosphokinase
LEAPISQAIIVANGALPFVELTRRQVAAWLDEEPGTLLVAADGGTHNALALGYRPAVVVGDLDSVEETTRQELAAQGCHFETAPARKDETDLELALRYVVERGAQGIRILGALGGRLDQTLGNILLLTLPVLDGVPTRIVEGRQTAWLVRAATDIRGAAGDTVSLIPLCGEAHGVTTDGLDYPLSDSRLPFGPGLGISNVMTGPRARVSLREGLLLAVHTAGGTALEGEPIGDNVQGG